MPKHDQFKKVLRNSRLQMNDVDPQAWLTQTLERLANGWPLSQLEHLMPWNFKPNGVG